MSKKILAMILFCDECDVDNVLLHIPLGLVIFASCLISGWLTLSFTYLFVKYERIEQTKIHDKCFPDLQGVMWGIGIPTIIALLRRLIIG